MRVVAKLCVLVLWLVSESALAQNDLITETSLLYRKRLQYGFHLNSSSLGGFNFKYQWQKTANIKNGFDIDLDRIRHPKETRVYGLSENPRQYTPGRINMAFFYVPGTDKIYLLPTVIIKMQYLFTTTILLGPPQLF